MSKHWDPRQSGWAGQWDRHRWPTRGRPSRKRAWWRITAGEARLVVLGGVMLGLWAGLHQPQTVVHPRPIAAAQAPAPIRVIDGDTFDHGGERIRIADIDTPELRGRCDAEEALARRARQRLETLLRERPFELRRLGRDEDRYGRKLRVVIRDGRSLGDRLVEEGLARTWTGRREPWC
jgi:endonuclease YncB( thermonuclease family)